MNDKDLNECVDQLERRAYAAASRMNNGAITDLNKRRALVLLDEMSDRFGEIYERIAAFEEQLDGLSDSIFKYVEEQLDTLDEPYSKLEKK